MKVHNIIGEFLKWVSIRGVKSFSCKVVLRSLVNCHFDRTVYSPAHERNDYSKHHKAGEFRKVVVMAGAGISVSAGIPDFRSKGGLYDQVRAKYRFFLVSVIGCFKSEVTR